MSDHRPNIVFVLTDDHGAHAISAYGSVINELVNVYDDPAYADVRERLKVAMWQEQSRLGDAPHPSQPVPPGCEDVEVAPMPKLPRYRWLDMGPMG